MAEQAVQDNVELEIKPTAWMRISVLIVLTLGTAFVLMLIFLLSGGGREFFERTTSLSTFMPDGTGLAPGSEVRLSGIPVGHVTKVDMSGSLDPQRVVRVDMRVNARFLPSIPVDSQTTIGADTLVGFKFVDIDEGKSPLPIAENGTLISEPVRQASDRADLVLSLQNELRQVDQLLQQISSADTPVGHFLWGEEEYNSILARITSFDASIHAMVRGNSPLGQALFSDVMYKSMRERVLKLDTQLQSIQKGEGATGKLFASDEQYNKLLASLKDLHASITRMGPKLQSDAAYEKVLKLLRDTDRMILTLTVGEGATAKLLQNAKLYESLYGSLHGMEVLLKDFREEPQKYMRYQVFNKNKKK